MISDSFYILLASNGSTDVYKNNSLSKFTNIFPSPLRTDSSWRVALQAISFDTRFSTVPSQIKGETHAILLWKQHTENGPIFYSEPSHIISIPQQVDDLIHLVSLLQGQIDPNICRILLNNNKVVIRTPKGYVIGIKDTVAEVLNINGSSHTSVAFHHVKGDYTKFKTLQIYNIEKIISNEQLEFQIKIPKTVSIVLEQMRWSNSGKQYHKILTTIPFAVLSDTRTYFYYEAQRREYYELLNSHPTYLSVQLVDESGVQLNLKSGQPTFIKLKFRKMENVLSMFSMRVGSNDSLEMYPSNNSSNFRINLARPIELPQGQHWEVALSSVHYPGHFSVADFVKDNIWFLAMKIGGGGVSGILAFSKETLEVRADVIDRIHKEMQKLGGGKISIQDNKIHLYGGSSGIELTLSLGLAKILGSPQAWMANGHDQTITVRAGKEIILAGNVFRVDELLPHSFLLYADIIQPINVGGGLSKVLQLIPNIPNKSSYFACKHLDFIPLNENRLSHMHFELCLHDGKHVPFVDLSQDVIINLLFRRKI